MNRAASFRSLGQEMQALRDRVRHLKSERAWLADGEWKESVLRSVLRRHLPTNAIVSTGYVVSGKWSSRQIDILIQDANRPALFRDGDVVLVTPDAVLGLIEVKTRLSPQKLRMAIQTLTADIRKIRLQVPGRAFAAMFAYEPLELVEVCLNSLVTKCTDWNGRIDFASFGPSQFVRYWELDPVAPHRLAQRWHGYNLDEMAMAYFVHNCVEAISPLSVNSNASVWYLPDGKEPYCQAKTPAPWCELPPR